MPLQKKPWRPSSVLPCVRLLSVVNRYSGLCISRHLLWGTTFWQVGFPSGRLVDGGPCACGRFVRECGWSGQGRMQDQAEKGIHLGCFLTKALAHQPASWKEPKLGTDLWFSQGGVRALGLFSPMSTSLWIWASEELK